MKIRIVVPALLLTMASISYGQAVPAGGNNTPISAIGSTPLLPSLDGVLHYALNGSEIMQFGYYGAGNTTYSTALSGDVGYTAKSVVFPFTMLFAGGVILGEPAGTGNPELLESGGHTRVRDEKLGIQHLRFFQFPATIAHHWSFGNTWCRRSWIVSGGGTCYRAGWRNILVRRRPNRQQPGWQC